MLRGKHLVLNNIKILFNLFQHKSKTGFVEAWYFQIQCLRYMTSPVGNLSGNMNKTLSSSHLWLWPQLQRTQLSWWISRSRLWCGFLSDSGPPSMHLEQPEKQKTITNWVKAQSSNKLKWCQFPRLRLLSYVPLEKSSLFSSLFLETLRPLKGSIHAQNATSCANITWYK